VESYVLNRGVSWQRLFEKAADFASFEELLEVMLAKQPMRICSCSDCLMANRWHFVLWPEGDGANPSAPQLVSNKQPGNSPRNRPSVHAVAQDGPSRETTNWTCPNTVRHSGCWRRDFAHLCGTLFAQDEA
jgi:hypothetical protein